MRKFHEGHGWNPLKLEQQMRLKLENSDFFLSSPGAVRFLQKQTGHRSQLGHPCADQKSKTLLFTHDLLRFGWCANAFRGKQLKVFAINWIFQQKAGYPPKHRPKGWPELSWLVIVYKLGGQVFHGLSLKQFLKKAMKNRWTLEGKCETCMHMHAPQTL